MIVENNKDSIIFKADSGASHHSLKPKDSRSLLKMNRISNRPTDTLLDNMQLHVTQQWVSPLSNILSTKAKKANILPLLVNSSLLSVGQLCDDDCWDILYKQTLYIFKELQSILSGNPKYHIDGLWDVELKTTK